ncbi:hypothetical protein HK101_008811 [Irineochytrium annulatum]|nr:hypothetical protein HK101_008811 [Irineochytrium annulatum]
MDINGLVEREREQATSFRDMVKKKREEVKHVSRGGAGPGSGTGTIGARSGSGSGGRLNNPGGQVGVASLSANDRDFLNRASKATIGQSTWNHSQTHLGGSRAEVGRSSTSLTSSSSINLNGGGTAISSKYTKKPHQISRREGGPGSSLPDLIADAPPSRMSQKKPLPSLRPSRSQTLSGSGEGTSSASTTSLSRAAQLQRRPSSSSKSLASSRRNLASSQTHEPPAAPKNRLSRAGSASKSSRTSLTQQQANSAAPDSHHHHHHDQQRSVPQVQAVAVHAHTRPASGAASVRASTIVRSSSHDLLQAAAAVLARSEAADHASEYGEGSITTSLKQEDFSCLRKENQPHLPKRQHRPAPEMPPWNSSMRPNGAESEENLVALGNGGRKTPLSMSRAGSVTALHRAEVERQRGRVLTRVFYTSATNLDRYKPAENRRSSLGTGKQVQPQPHRSVDSDVASDRASDDDADSAENTRSGHKYPVTPHQLLIYTRVCPTADDDDSPAHAHLPPLESNPYYVSQAYQLNCPVNADDLGMVLNKICFSYKVLGTRFWRNEKIVDGDVEGHFDQKPWDQMSLTENLDEIRAEEWPDLAVINSRTLSRFVRQRMSNVQGLDRPFMAMLIRDTPMYDSAAAVPPSYLLLVASTAICDDVSLTFAAREVLGLYFECDQHRALGGTEFQLMSLIRSHMPKEEGDDFVDFAYGFTVNRHAHLFWRGCCIETVQDVVEGPEREDLEAQVKKAQVEVEAFRAQVFSLSRRRQEVEAELNVYKDQRKQMDAESYEAIETYSDPVTGESVEISKAAKSALIRIVLGEEAVTDNVSALLAKHEVHQDIQRQIGNMTLETFSAISEEQLIIFGILTKDRRKLMALSEYVRNRVKESLQEQAKVKFSLERKIMKFQRELDSVAGQLKQAQNALDAQDDMGIRLRTILNPPSVEVKIPVLTLEGQMEPDADTQRGIDYTEVYGYVGFEVDAAVSRNIRKFRDRCRQNHRQRLLKLRKGTGAITTASSGHHSGNELSDFSSADERDDARSEADDGRRTPSLLSSDAVCLSAFQVMLKHISGCDKFLIGVRESLRKNGVLVGPLSDVMPLRVDLTRKGVTFNSLLVSVIKSLRDLKRHGAGCPFESLAWKFECDARFPIQFEFVSDRETQQWKEAGLSVPDILARRRTDEYARGGSDVPAKVERLWAVNESDQFDIKLIVVEDGDDICGGMVYRRDKYDEEKVAKWVQKYHTTLEGIEVGTRDVSISSLISRFASIPFFFFFFWRN